MKKRTHPALQTMASFPFCVLVDSDAWLNDHLKTNVINYFKIKRKSGGGENVIEWLSATRFKVSFAEIEAQSRVLQKQDHIVSTPNGDVKLTVRSIEELQASAQPGHENLFSSEASDTSFQNHNTLAAGCSNSPRAYHHSEKTDSLTIKSFPIKVDSFLVKYLREDDIAASVIQDDMRQVQGRFQISEEEEDVVYLIAENPKIFSDGLTQESVIETAFRESIKKFTCHYETNPLKRQLLIKNDALVKAPSRLYNQLHEHITVIIGQVEDVCSIKKQLEFFALQERRSTIIQSVMRVENVAEYSVIQDAAERELMRSCPYLHYSLEKEQSQVVLKGTPDEVCTARHIIQTHLLSVIRKPMTLSNRKSNFIQMCGVLEFSSHFPSKLAGKVNLEVTEQITLIGTSSRHITEAEEFIHRAVKEETISIFTEEATGPSLNISELRHFLASLQNKYNQPSKSIQVCERDGNVVVVGFTQCVQRVKQEIINHLNSTAITTDTISLKKPEIANYFCDLLDLFRLGDSDISMQIQHTPEAVVVLTGVKHNVCKTKQNIEQALNTLKWEVLTMSQPGACKFFQGSGKMYVDIISSNTDCIIKLKSVSSGGSRTTAEATGGEQYGHEVSEWGSFILDGGLNVSVCMGNITSQRADAIVHPTNEELSFIGDIGKAISNDGGPSIKKECQESIKNKGRLLIGQARMTSAGELPCQRVIHVAVPRWKKDSLDHQDFIKHLKSAFGFSFHEAENAKLTTIAMPCLSFAKCAASVSVSGECIICAIQTFAPYAKNIRRITLTDTKWDKVAELKKLCEKEWRSASASHLQAEASADLSEHSNQQETFRDKIVAGNIEDQKADVLVAPLTSSFKLDDTKVGKVLHRKGGQILQFLVTELSSGRSLTIGDVLKIRVADIMDIGCKEIFFILCTERTLDLFVNQFFSGGRCKGYEQYSHAKFQWLKRGINDCIMSCHRKGMESIVFPVIGTGKVVGVPHCIVARMLLEEISTFEKQYPLTPLKSIKIVIHASDNMSPAAFYAASRDLQLYGTGQTAKDADAFFRSLTSFPDILSMMVGKIKVQIHYGDITTESSDVIVNPVNFFGQVSTGKIPENGVLCTGPGKLNCKTIMHVSCQSSANSIKKVVHSVIQSCDNHNYKSVSFPAIETTGLGGMDPYPAAEALITAIAEIASTNSISHLSLIRIVILQRDIFLVYRDCLKNKYGMSAPRKKWNEIELSSLTNRKADCIPKIMESTELFPLAVFDIMGGPQSNIETAKENLQRVIQDQFSDECIEDTDNQISKLESREEREILELAKEFDVRITIEKGFLGRIRVQGLMQDVKGALNKIHQLLRIALQNRLSNHEHKLLSKAVNWYFKKNNEYSAFDSETSFEIEKLHRTFCSGSDDLEHIAPFQGKTLLISFDNNIATVLETDEVIRLKRVDTVADDLPLEWDEMKNDSITIVELDKNSSEFINVALHFMSTSNCKIVKIERIQNPHLYRAFSVKRKQMVEKNGSDAVNELMLFHGTTIDACKGINSHGFNRGFSGQNAARYGEGVYFAVESSYSTNSTYSRPDLSDMRYIYRARVLAGRYTEGKRGLRVPPPRLNFNPYDRYDSVVDSKALPTMYVIFHDDQAYPEYLITFH
ncbi:protein mono-ADP-ribosyltransferase PARP14-like [Protopterus annectens]|uniref:protein mono-ADP-ribosyltransferase PARP14-like n=1 Tax=Protopterus annectens TaxID=7888 RepID=UPI001CFB92D3|nr:protein mono-ADP-ribosyltransferase PARP14-like [Protopterus annectens]